MEQEGAKVHFIKVKGHMNDHKGFLDKFRCAKGNKLADEYATKGMPPRTIVCASHVGTQVDAGGGGSGWCCG